MCEFCNNFKNGNFTYPRDIKAGEEFTMCQNCHWSVSTFYNNHTNRIEPKYLINVYAGEDVKKDQRLKFNGKGEVIYAPDGKHDPSFIGSADADTEKGKLCPVRCG